MKRIDMLMIFAILFCFAINAGAQDYPVKPVRVLVPFSKGSATDLLARGVSEKLSEIWGHPVVAENVPGKGGTIATNMVAKTPPDGYTLLVHGAFAINPSFYKNLPYDPIKDFTDIVPLVRQPLALVVSKSADIKSVSDLIALAKSKPRQLKFGSPGTGSAAHLTAEKFRIMAGLDMEHVAYKGGPETLAAINSGDVSFSFLPIAFAKKSAEKGRILLLGVTSVQRTSVMPDIPTITEAGLTGFEYNHWWGVWGPADIPIIIVEKIEKDVARSLATPELKNLLLKLGVEPIRMTSKEFQKFVHHELESVARTVKEGGIKPK